jgi:hypothetical protein
MTIHLGPTTERRFSEAFAVGATVTRKVAARLLGMDVKTLDAMRERRLIRAVWRGKVPAYTERDLRSYLTADPFEHPPEVSPPSGFTASSPASKPVSFSVRPARLRVARRGLASVARLADTGAGCQNSNLAKAE